MDKISEQISHQRRSTDGKQTYKNMLNIICHQGVANGNSEIYHHIPIGIAKSKK